MNGPYWTTLFWLILAALGGTPAVIAAIFGRGRFVIAAAVFSLLAVIAVSPAVNLWLMLILPRAADLPLIMVLYHLRWPIVLATLSALFATLSIKTQRQRDDHFLAILGAAIFMASAALWFVDRKPF
jgi:Fe2+ transport system protein B